MNKKVEDLKRSFYEKALVPETLFLLSPEAALTYLDAGLILGLKLAGVEGFRITSGGAYQPSQSFSNDISETSDDGIEFAKITKELMRKGMQENIYFQVVFEEGSDN